MDAKTIKRSFELLDHALDSPLRLIMGGGGALLLAYGHHASTAAIDVVPKPYRPVSDFEEILHDIAKKLKLPADWLNTYFTEFTYVLPEDYENRLKNYFQGKKLTVDC